MEVLLLILGFNVISIRAKHKQREREDAVAAFNDRHVLRESQNLASRGDVEENFDAETESLKILDRIYNNLIQVTSGRKETILGNRTIGSVGSKRPSSGG